MSKEKMRGVKEIISNNPEIEEAISNLISGKDLDFGESIGKSTRKVYRIKIQEGEYWVLKINPNLKGDLDRVIGECAFFNYLKNRKYPTPEFTIIVEHNGGYGILTEDLTKGGLYKIEELNFDKLKNLENYPYLLKTWAEYHSSLEKEFGNNIDVCLFVLVKDNKGKFVFGDGDNTPVSPEIIEELKKDNPNKEYLISLKININLSSPKIN